MKNKHKIYLCFLFWPLLIAVFFDCVSAETTTAPAPGSIVINELMWMGSYSSIADEWIELKNLTSENIDFSKTPWSIYKNDELMLAISEKTLRANGFFLISNNKKNYVFSKGESILNIDPDIVDTAVSLSNLKAQYKLYASSDNTGILIDTADNGAGDPLAGNSDEKKSMERNTTPGDGTKKENWHTCSQGANLDASSLDCGTPREENSKKLEPKEYPANIRINELSPNPSEGQEEYIELYNSAEESLDLSDWIIKDATKTGKYVFPKTSLMNPKNYLVVYKKDFGFALNNAGNETVYLFDPNEKETDRVSYSGSKKDYSYSFDSSGWHWTSKLTPGKTNKFDEPLTKKVKIISFSPNPKGSDTKNEWLEIQNNSKKKINLKGWSIAAGWKNLYNHPIRKDFILKKGESKKLTRKSCAFTLNNEKTKLELRHPDGEVAQKIKYDRKNNKIEEDEIFVISGKSEAWIKPPDTAKEQVSASDTAEDQPDETEKAVPDDDIWLDQAEMEASLGKYSPNPAWKTKQENRVRLAAFSTVIKPKVILTKTEKKVLGVEKIRHDENYYTFTDNETEKHWAIKLTDSLWKKINSNLTWILTKI